MKIGKIISYLISSVIGALTCLFYHSTAIYSYGPAKGDSQFGWPFRYGFDQSDVPGEFFYKLSGFNWIACTIDALFGIVIGLSGCAIILWFYNKKKTEPEHGPYRDNAR